MIRSLADLLDTIRKRELDALQAFGVVRHGPMIGDMYEGLTKEILRRGIFEGLDLRIVDGKVRWTDGSLSGQIDCIIVVGEGEQLPFTNHWIYPAEKVIAVISVKKRLYASEIVEAHENLLSVIQSNEYYFSHIPWVKGAYRTICSRDIPSPAQYENRPLHDKEILGSLVFDLESPVRIVMGYEGYATESGLRESFVDYLDKYGAEGQPGFSPSSFPNLLICGEHCLVRLNGMPFGGALIKSPPYYAQAVHDSLPNIFPGPEEWWPWIASTSGISSRLLLEILWTRLSYQFGISATIFGEDLTVERFSPLLLGKAGSTEGKVGWFYLPAPPITEADLLANRVEDPWTPVEVGIPPAEWTRS